MKVNINYEVKIGNPVIRELARPWEYAGRHFSLALDNLKDLLAARKTDAIGKDKLGNNVYQRPRRESLFDVVCHFSLGLLETLPVINLIIAIADRKYFKSIPLINRDKPDLELRKLSEAEIPPNPQKVTNDIYYLMQVTHDILTKNKIPYTAVDGTQLGATRHKGLIPWDDDGDVATLSKYKEKILDLRKEFRDRGCDIHWSTFLYGIIIVYKMDGKPQLFGSFKYPAVDIYLLDKKGDRYEYSGWVSHYQFPAYITEEEWNNIGDVDFGHLLIKGLKNQYAEAYLKRNYGPRCLTTAVRTHTHGKGVLNRDESRRELFFVDEAGKEPARSEEDPKRVTGRPSGA